MAGKSDDKRIDKAINKEFSRIASSASPDSPRKKANAAKKQTQLGSRTERQIRKLVKTVRAGH